MLLLVCCEPHLADQNPIPVMPKKKPDMNMINSSMRITHWW